MLPGVVSIAHQPVDESSVVKPTFVALADVEPADFSVNSTMARPRMERRNRASYPLWDRSASTTERSAHLAATQICG
jgi:hypothetical protein